jgi:hypothetical protein
MNTQLTKRALFSKGALSAGAGLGTLALFAQRASTDTPFTAFAFPATGAPTPRTMPDRLAEVINVKDFGAVGDGQTNDTAAIQAAFDAAFGPASNPHGTNSSLNRPVFFPSGIYRTATLTLTDVMGGYIFGAGNLTTTLIYAGSVPGRATRTPLILTNGFSYSRIENISVTMTGKSSISNTAGIILDWDGGRSVGLHDNTLMNVKCDNANYGIRIAASGYGGRNISLFSVALNGNYCGMKLEGPECQVTGVGGSAADNAIGVWVAAGSFGACGGYQLSGVTQLDIQHDSPGITSVYGTRSEARDFCNVTNGKLYVSGFDHQSAAAGFAVNGTSSGEVCMSSCSLGEINTPNGGRITGGVNLFLRSVLFLREGVDTIFYNFTGKIYEYLKDETFTYATLPSSPGEGLTVNISDPNTVIWGAPVTQSGLAGHALIRWNGSAWTVVGK